MKNAVLVLCLFFFLGCTIEYDLLERYSITTNIADTNNNPIANVKVSVYFVFNESTALVLPYSSETSGGLFWSSRDETDLVSFATTDENGFISLNFPLPKKSFETIRLVIANENETYANFTLADIVNEDFSDNALEIQSLKLIKLEELVGLGINNGIEEEGYFLQSYQLDDSAFYSLLPFDNLTILPSFISPSFFSVLKNQQVSINVQIINTNVNPSEIIEFTDQINVEDDYTEYWIELP